MLLMQYFSPTLNVFLNVVLLWTGSHQLLSAVFTVIYIYIYCVCVCVSLIARKISTREAFPTKLCCILRGPGGERILDIVPGGTELGSGLRRRVGQDVHILNNPQVECTGVLFA